MSNERIEPIDILAELDALLREPPKQQVALPAWLGKTFASGDVRDLDDSELCELAAEPVKTEEGGPLAAAAALFEGLRVRHSHDRITLAALTALQDYHLPALNEAKARRAQG